MANFFDQTPVFINPWDSQQTFSPHSNENNVTEDEPKGALPYRRPSLNQLQQESINYQRQSSWSSMSSYSSTGSSSSSSTNTATDLFGSIWYSNNNNNNNNNNNCNSSNSNSALPSPSFGFPSCSSPTSLTRSFPITNSGSTQDQIPRPYRRFSLAPISYETTQDKMNSLSSVPEEPYQPYRRHSLAGPFLSNTTTANSSSSIPSTTTNVTSLPKPIMLSSSLTVSTPLPSPMPTCIEEESNLLPMELFNSVDPSDKSSASSSNPISTSSVSWCMVEFKAGRAEIYYSTMPSSSIQLDDWVIVEADRGRDLGKIVAKDLPLDQVQLLLHATASSTTVASTNTYTTTPNDLYLPTPSLSSSSSSSSSFSPSHLPFPPSSTNHVDNGNNALPLPKRICRLATSAEITLLVTKRHDEQKALLICQTKSKQKNLLMDIVDAEYQWDRRKLTFYFVADRRVDFRELVRDLFKIYKTRIWMCSVNSVGKRV